MATALIIPMLCIRFLVLYLVTGSLYLLTVCVFIHQVMSNSLGPHGLWYARPPCPSPSPRVCPHSCPLNWWCHPTISSSVSPFSFCLQSFPASGSFPVSAVRFRWPKYWSFGFSISPSSDDSGLIAFESESESRPLGLTVLISLQSKGLSRVFSRTAVQKHQFFGALASLWSYCHVHAWPM